LIKKVSESKRETLVLIDDLHFIVPDIQRYLVKSCWDLYGSVSFLSDYQSKVLPGNQRVLVPDRFLEQVLQEHRYLIYTAPNIWPDIDQSLIQLPEGNVYLNQKTKDLWCFQVRDLLSGDRPFDRRFFLDHLFFSQNAHQYHLSFHCFNDWGDLPWLSLSGKYYACWCKQLEALPKVLVKKLLGQDRKKSSLSWLAVEKISKDLENCGDRFQLQCFDKGDRKYFTDGFFKSGHMSLFKDRRFIRQRLMQLDLRMAYLIQFKSLKERMKWKVMYRLNQVRNQMIS
jgi:hypothetical protein